MDLVILAGGLGSRFGGLKQIEPVDDFGNFIIDFSIFDAIKCGFDRVIFIINENNYEIFQKTIGKRISEKICVKYVFQNFDNVPANFNFPKDRTKPLGTAHAILCAKDVVEDKFAVINADDYYGFEAINQVTEFLKNNNLKNEYALVGYKLKNTTNKNETVKRGVCNVNNNELESLVECKILSADNGYVARQLDECGKESEQIGVCEDTLVSMNLFGFNFSIFKYLENEFFDFLNENMNSFESCEFYISTFLSKLTQNHKINVKILPTDSCWMGMTYKEDKEIVKEKIKKLKQKGIYPNNLWN